MKIAPYEDEKEGFTLSQTQSKPAPEPTTAPSRDESPDDSSEKDLEKEDLEKDGERDAAGADHVAPPPAHPEDPNIVGWIGPNDEDNPQNWSAFRKFFTFAQICLLTFSSMLKLVRLWCCTEADFCL
jgi:DHA1 family multidrug resistance protein-like MFS transporter